jgi:predicted dienelactone hydrolase
MGAIILIISAAIEIVFTIYCIATKSNQKIIRSWIRISAFALFVIMTIATVIQWSFRWYLLAAILLIWTISGGVSLIRTKTDKKANKNGRTILKAIAMWLIVVIAVTPALIFPQYKLPKITGKHTVNTVVYTYTDNNRVETFKNSGKNRKVTVEFWYPADVHGRYPLVVFSPGSFGIRTSNSSTFRELASNGYIVCSIDHTYHSLFVKDTYENLTMIDKSFMQEVIDINNGVYDEKTEYQLEQKWLKVRTDDMNFVIDTIINRSSDSKSDKVYQIVDNSKIGLIGHSLGGAACAQLGRERKDINAVINLDSDLFGEEIGVVNGQPVINDKVYPVPLLSIYTDTMEKLMNSVTDPNSIPQKRISATSPNAYEVYITGTNHMSLTDLPLVSPFLVNMIDTTIKKADGGHEANKYYVIETMNRLVLDFFNHYLKGEGDFHPADKY